MRFDSRPPPDKVDAGDALEQARRRLRSPEHKNHHWEALAAAAFFAIAALGFAMVSVMAPPLTATSVIKAPVR